MRTPLTNQVTALLSCPYLVDERCINLLLLFIYSLKIMIMSMLGKLFKRKKGLKPSTELKLCIIDDTTSDLWITLGITEKRRDEIVDICKNAYNNHETKTNSYKEIVDQCNHVNEIIPACIVFERMCEIHNNPLTGLIQVFGREND